MQQSRGTPAGFSCVQIVSDDLQSTKYPLHETLTAISSIQQQQQPSQSPLASPLSYFIVSMIDNRLAFFHFQCNGSIFSPLLARQSQSNSMSQQQQQQKTGVQLTPISDILFQSELMACIHKKETVTSLSLRQISRQQIANQEDSTQLPTKKKPLSPDIQSPCTFEISMTLVRAVVLIEVTLSTDSECCPNQNTPSSSPSPSSSSTNTNTTPTSSSSSSGGGVCLANWYVSNVKAQRIQFELGSEIQNIFSSTLSDGLIVSLAKKNSTDLIAVTSIHSQPREVQEQQEQAVIQQQLSVIESFKNESEKVLGPVGVSDDHRLIRVVTCDAQDHRRVNLHTIHVESDGQINRHKRPLNCALLNSNSISSSSSSSKEETTADKKNVELLFSSNASYLVVSDGSHTFEVHDFNNHTIKTIFKEAQKKSLLPSQQLFPNPLNFKKRLAIIDRQTVIVTNSTAATSATTAVSKPNIKNGSANLGIYYLGNPIYDIECASVAGNTEQQHTSITSVVVSSLGMESKEMHSWGGSDSFVSVNARRSRGGYTHTNGGEKNAILIDDEFIVVDEDDADADAADEEADYCEILEREERLEEGGIIPLVGKEQQQNKSKWTAAVSHQMKDRYRLVLAFLENGKRVVAMLVDRAMIAARIPELNYVSSQITAYNQDDSFSALNLSDFFESHSYRNLRKSKSVQMQQCQLLFMQQEPFKTPGRKVLQNISNVQQGLSGGNCAAATAGGMALEGCYGELNMNNNRSSSSFGFLRDEGHRGNSGNKRNIGYSHSQPLRQSNFKESSSATATAKLGKHQRNERSSSSSPVHGSSLAVLPRNTRTQPLRNRLLFNEDSCVSMIEENQLGSKAQPIEINSKLQPKSTSHIYIQEDLEEDHSYQGQQKHLQQNNGSNRKPIEIVEEEEDYINFNLDDTSNEHHFNEEIQDNDDEDAIISCSESKNSTPITNVENKIQTNKQIADLKQNCTIKSNKNINQKSNSINTRKQTEQTKQSKKLLNSNDGYFQYMKIPKITLSSSNKPTSPSSTNSVPPTNKHPNQLQLTSPPQLTPQQRQQQNQKQQQHVLYQSPQIQTSSSYRNTIHDCDTDMDDIVESIPSSTSSSKHNSAAKQQNHIRNTNKSASKNSHHRTKYIFDAATGVIIDQIDSNTDECDDIEQYTDINKNINRNNQQLHHHYNKRISTTFMKGNASRLNNNYQNINDDDEDDDDIECYQNESKRAPLVGNRRSNEIDNNNSQSTPHQSHGGDDICNIQSQEQKFDEFEKQQQNQQATTRIKKPTVSPKKHSHSNNNSTPTMSSSNNNSNPQSNKVKRLPGTDPSMDIRKCFASAFSLQSPNALSSKDQKQQQQQEIQGKNSENLGQQQSHESSATCIPTIFTGRVMIGMTLPSAPKVVTQSTQQQQSTNKTQLQVQLNQRNNRIKQQQQGMTQTLLFASHDKQLCISKGAPVVLSQKSTAMEVENSSTLVPGVELTQRKKTTQSEHEKRAGPITSNMEKNPSSAPVVAVQRQQENNQKSDLNCKRKAPFPAIAISTGQSTCGEHSVMKTRKSFQK